MVTSNDKVRVLVLMAILCSNLAAYSDSHALSGRMAWWQQAVGTWSCKIVIEPTQGEAAVQWVAKATGSIVIGNVFHWHDKVPGAEVDQYDGYSTARRIWWETQADSLGYATILDSTNGHAYNQISAPPTSADDQGVYREVYSFDAAGRFHISVERKFGDSWRPYSYASCEKRGAGK